MMNAQAELSFRLPGLQFNISTVPVEHKLLVSHTFSARVPQSAVLHTWAQLLGNKLSPVNNDHEYLCYNVLSQSKLPCGSSSSYMLILKTSLLLAPGCRKGLSLDLL